MKKGLAVFLSILLLLSLCLFSCEKTDRVKCVDIKLTSEQYAFGVSHENKELYNSACSLIDKIKKDGTLKSILEKYFSENEDEYLWVSAGIESADKNQLIVATHTPFSPFEFSKYESSVKMYAGVDIEIAHLLAEELDAELVIKDVPFNEILTSVSSGHADIAMAGISVSDERTELVDFTDSYYEASQVIVVKGDDTRFNSCKTKEDVELILNSLSPDTVVGCQSDTTSELYITGDSSLGFDGYDLIPVGFESPVLATQALINGNVSLVIMDEGAALSIVDSIND
ncbi:MAG: transporter substrate-binding domain-containing protein [Clostridia bacterium]|nr:transporter substrate-binding domain-containing protein [Clostridia bacterium]